MGTFKFCIGSYNISINLLNYVYYFENIIKNIKCYYIFIFIVGLS